MDVNIFEKNTYRIRRIKAYRKYFWVVKDVLKHCFLWRGGGWHGFVTLKFPMERDSIDKSEILESVPGYFSSKEEALLCLKQCRGGDKSY